MRRFIPDLSELTFALVILVMLAALPPVSAAGPIQRQTVGVSRLARTADAIVLTSCDSDGAAWSGDPPIIVTRYRCRVERAFKGQAADPVMVQVLGGRMGKVSMDASAGAKLTPGTSMVLMLRRSQFGPYYVVAGGTSGALPVTGPLGKRRVRGMALDDFARWVNQ
jgi:hypothetical protein